MYDEEAVAAVNAAGLFIVDGKDLRVNNGLSTFRRDHPTSSPIIARQVGDGTIFTGDDAVTTKFEIDKDGNIPVVGTVDGVKISAFQSKVIEIGDWDMSATGAISVEHGLTLANIRDVSAIVRKDDGSGYYPLTPGWIVTPAEVQGYILSINPTVVNLFRTEGGSFDSANYSSIPYNRGWITIWYVP